MIGVKSMLNSATNNERHYCNDRNHNVSMYKSRLKRHLATIQKIGNVVFKADIYVQVEKQGIGSIERYPHYGLRSSFEELKRS